MALRARLFALTYDRLMARTERAGLADIRNQVLAHAVDDVLEIGAGTGGNLAFYGPAVRTLTLTEPDPSMLRRLMPRTVRSPRPVTVLRAPAEDLPFDDEAFDTVVSTLVLCGVSDQPRAVREIARVLKPGGRLLFIEHVRSDQPTVALRQDRLNWVNSILCGCDCNRPTLRTLELVGLVIDVCTHGDLPKSPSFVRPLISGIAMRAAGTTADSHVNGLRIGEHL